MTEVYFGGDGCPTCGRAVEDPWNRSHAEWCASMRRQQFEVDLRRQQGLDYSLIRDADRFRAELERHATAVARRSGYKSSEPYLLKLRRRAEERAS